MSIPRLFIACLAALTVAGGAVSGPASFAGPRPRLILFISVDQFRSDYVTRYGHLWTQGLRRLFDRGAFFSQAAYPYMNTVTCVGHATMSTGALPATHGMVLNEWWDREAGRPMRCTDDPSARNIAHGSVAARGGDSPWRLLVPTFSDELRTQTQVPPRIVAVSLKARAAITLAGRRADLATWYDGERGFVTSSAYASGPVPFLQAFQSAHPVNADAGATWTRTLPPAAYAYVDDGAGEQPPAPWTALFPHALPGAPGRPEGRFYALWEETPRADEYLATLAMAAAREFKMGQGPGTDFLAVSFSALDVVGHDFGPASHEVQDLLVRLDATLGRVLDELDNLVGADRCVVALTSDHGVMPLLPQLADAGIPSGRIDSETVARRVNEALAPSLGAGQYVDAVFYTELYFKTGIYDQLVARPDLMKAVVSAIEGTPGVLRVVRSDEIDSGSVLTDPVAHATHNSYVPGRSGDLMIVPRPYFLTSMWDVKTGRRTHDPTSHGTGYGYDTRVPLLLAGPGIAAGEYLVPASPVDLAPTLAYLAGITMARTDGRVLREALDTTSAGRASRPTAATGPGQSHAQPADKR